MKYSSNRRSKASVISAYERREYSGRQIGWRRVLWYLVLIFCTAVTMWSMYGSRFLLRQFKNSTLVEGGMDLEQRQLLPLGVHVEGLSSLREGAGAGTAKMQIGRGVLVKPEGHYEFEKGAEPQVMSPNEGKVVLGGGQRETVVDAIPDPFAFEDLNDPPRPQQQQQQRRDQQDQQQGQREQQQQQQSWGGGAPDPITMNDGTTRWQRAPLVPSTLNNIVFTKVSPRAIPPISKFVRDVAKDRDTLLVNLQDHRDSYRITKGLKLYVAPVSAHTMFCLNQGKECDNTLGCWDKRLWLYAREAFHDVNPKEADFVLMPYFHYCFFYMKDCFARYAKRGTNPMEILNLIYNETVNHLEEVAPGRNWSRRIVVPLSHDYGGCVNFGLTTTEKKHRIVGQPPLLQDAIVLAALGDYDETCYIPGKDIVFPAFIDHETLDGAIIKSSKRSYEIYFGGTLRFDTRRPGLRKILADPANYQHMEKHIIGYVKPRSNYSHVIHNTAFCLGPPGVVGWTGRVWEALWAGCIPVFLTENTAHPWEEYVDYRKFSLHYTYSDAPNMEKLLAEITPEERDRLQEEGQKVRDLFVYKIPYTQENGPMSYLFKALRKRKVLLDAEAK